MVKYVRLFKQGTWFADDRKSNFSLYPVYADGSKSQYQKTKTKIYKEDIPYTTIADIPYITIEMEGLNTCEICNISIARMRREREMDAAAGAWAGLDLR